MAKIYESIDEFVADIIDGVLTRFQMDFTRYGSSKKLLDDVSLSILHFQLVSTLTVLISPNLFNALKAKAMNEKYGDQKCMENALNRIVGNLNASRGEDGQCLKVNFETRDNLMTSGICQIVLDDLNREKLKKKSQGFFMKFFSAKSNSSHKNEDSLYSISEETALFTDNRLELERCIIEIMSNYSRIDLNLRNRP